MQASHNLYDLHKQSESRFKENRLNCDIHFIRKRLKFKATIHVLPNLLQPDVNDTSSMAMSPR